MPLLLLWQAKDDLFGMDLFIVVTFLMGTAFTILLVKEVAPQGHNPVMVPPPMGLPAPLPPP